MTIQQLIDALNSFEDKTQEALIFNDFICKEQTIEAVGACGNGAIVYCNAD